MHDAATDADTDAPMDAAGLTRRRVLSGAALGGVDLIAVACTDDSALTRSGASTSDASTSDTPHETTAEQTVDTLALAKSDTTLGEGTFSLFAQNDLNFQTLLALGGAGLNAEVGEVTSVVDQTNAAVGGATYQGLYDSMIAMGNRLDEQAAAAVAKGHVVSARSQYLRAAQYYNQALYWVLGTSTPDAEAATYTAMNDAFIEAAKLMDPAWERLEIPYEGTKLNGWFWKPAGASGRRPTIILNNGSDGQNIDMVAQGGSAGLERGYNVVVFEGPGQGNQLFLDNVPFTPDWGKVVTAVVDQVIGRDDVDADKLALRGISFGGLLVPIAGATEHRVKALVADPGAISSFDAFPPVITGVASAGNGGESDVNGEWDGIQSDLTAEDAFNLKKRLEIYSAEAHDQVKKGEVPSDFYGLAKTMKSYDYTEELARATTAPTLVTAYEQDSFFDSQKGKLTAMLKAAGKQADTYDFTKAEGAQYHCGPMAPQRVAEVVYDWLDEQFAR